MILLSNPCSSARLGRRFRLEYLLCIDCSIVLEIVILQQRTLLIRVRDIVKHSTQLPVYLSGSQSVSATCGQSRSSSSAPLCPQYHVNRCCLKLGICLFWLGMFAVVSAFGSECVLGPCPQSRDITLSLSLFGLMSTALLPRDAVLVRFCCDPALLHHCVIWRLAIETCMYTPNALGTLPLV